MSSLPNDIDAWRAELASAYAAARSTLSAGDDTDDEELWHHMEDRAVYLARSARGLPELAVAPEDLDRTVDAITDLTERLRRYGGGNPEDHHISEQQFFLLYYVAAQVHGGALSEAMAGAVVRDCWGEAADDDDEPSDDDEEGYDDDEEDEEEEEEEEEPWPITRPPPASPGEWLAEVRSAWRDAGRPPPLRSAEGRPVMATGHDLRESGVILALQKRGCTPPAEGVYGLIGVISEMEADIAQLGPELAELKRKPPMAFVLYYVWTHILIGHADEETALTVVREAAGHLDDFAAGGPAPRQGSSRYRRSN